MKTMASGRLIVNHDLPEGPLGGVSTRLSSLPSAYSRKSRNISSPDRRTIDGGVVAVARTAAKPGGFSPGFGAPRDAAV
jgi:hypothetical protein